MTARRTLGEPIRRPGADLHVHTTHSDGRCSPGEVVRAAAAAGIDALAVTDHDTVNGVEIARREATRLGIELIPGIELSAQRNGRSTHVLGYFIRDNDAALLETTGRLRQLRLERRERMIEALRGFGFVIEEREIVALFSRGTAGRRQLADYLVHSGQVPTVREVFTRWLGDNGPASAPSPALDWTEAVALIRHTGGVAALAHPPYDLRAVDLAAWKDAGLSAVEVDGPGISPRLGTRWRDWAKSLDLIPIGGSDFHVADRPGARVGSILTAPEQLQELRARAPSSAPRPGED